MTYSEKPFRYNGTAALRSERVGAPRLRVKGTANLQGSARYSQLSARGATNSPIDGMVAHVELTGQFNPDSDLPEKFISKPDCELDQYVIMFPNEQTGGEYSFLCTIRLNSQDQTINVHVDF